MKHHPVTADSTLTLTRFLQLDVWPIELSVCRKFASPAELFILYIGGQTAPVRLGSPGFPSCAGPLANSFEDLEFLVRNVIDTKPWNVDAFSIAFPWRSSVAAVASPKIKIGYFHGDPDFKVQPPVSRTLETAVKKLTAAGFTVVPIPDTPSMGAGVDLCSDCYSLDNSKRFLQFITSSGEPMIPSLAKTIVSLLHVTRFRDV